VKRGSQRSYIEADKEDERQLMGTDDKEKKRITNDSYHPNHDVGENCNPNQGEEESDNVPRPPCI